MTDPRRRRETGGALRRENARALRAAGILFVCAAVVYVGTEAIAASAFPGYSYARNYISDLGVPEVGVHEGRAIDSPLSAVMNAGFIAQGVLFLAATLLAARGRRSGGRTRVPWVVLAALHSVGIILVALVHGSPQAAASGTIGVHVAGAGLAIVCGNLAAASGGIALGRGPLRVFSVAIAGVGLLSLIGLQVHLSSSTAVPDGIWERGSVYTITAWELVAGLVLLSRHRGSHGRSGGTADPGH